jgi:succinate dehydrogenase/fumarate reductase cytochrome b subunit
VSRLTNRFTGVVIVGFVLVHVIVQALLHVEGWRETFGQFAWLYAIQQMPVVHATLYFSIAFHTLYGLKLIAGDLGYTTDYRTSFHLIFGISALFALREIARYVGI